MCVALESSLFLFDVPFLFVVFILSYFFCECFMLFVFFFKQKTAYEMRISDWSSDVCSSDLGASYDLGGHWRIGLNGSRTERAPTAEELFANGGHAGTQAYELGNPNFKLEKSWGLEATLHHHTDAFSFDASEIGRAHV